MINTRSFLEQQYSLEDRAVFVTNASRGIGRIFALARAGAVVSIQGRSEDRLQETATRTERAGGRTTSFTMELDNVRGLSTASPLVETCLMKSYLYLGKLLYV